MLISSPNFSNGGMIPRKFTQQGEDISPAIEITDLPEGAKSIVLVCMDPDAPDPQAPKRTELGPGGQQVDAQRQTQSPRAHGPENDVGEKRCHDAKLAKFGTTPKPFAGKRAFRAGRYAETAKISINTYPRATKNGYLWSSVPFYLYFCGAAAERARKQGHTNSKIT